MTQTLQFSRWLSIWMLDLIDAVTNGFDTRADSPRRFNALWVPVAIIIAGAVAMTIFCTLRGYDGWEWKWTWRGLRARCV